MVLTWNKGASQWVWLAWRQCRHEAGGWRGVATVFDLRWALCQMQDRRAVSVSPAKWRGSRSLRSIVRGATSSFLSLKGHSGLSSITGRGALGPGFSKELGLLSALAYPKMQGAASLGEGTAALHGQALAPAPSQTHCLGPAVPFLDFLQLTGP